MVVNSKVIFKSNFDGNTHDVDLSHLSYLKGKS